MVDDKNILEFVAALLLKIFVVVALFFPVMTSYVENQELNGAYPEKILVNFVALLFMMVFLVSRFLHNKFEIKNKWIVLILTMIMIVYIDAYMDNMDVIQWIWQARNTIISFGMFVILLAADDKYFFEKYHIKEFTIISIVVTHIVGIIVHFNGYLAMHMYNGKLRFIRWNFQNYHEKRFHWIYSYKCQFAMMLILFIAFFIVNKDKFKNRVLYCLSLLILIICLIICNTRSAVIMGLFIILMNIFDISAQESKKKEWMLLGIVPIIIGGLVLLKKLVIEKDVSSLGQRLWIWPATIEKIKENPKGIGLRFTFEKITLANGLIKDNGHNIFLNEILRLGIIVGVCFSLFIIIVVIRGFFKKISFFTFGVLVAFIVEASMDYSILPSELTMVMFMLYCIFYLPDQECKSKK